MKTSSVRHLGARVAMKKAVGNPIRREITVVTADSQKDLRIISSVLKLSARLSSSCRSKRKRSHASPDSSPQCTPPP